MKTASLLTLSLILLFSSFAHPLLTRQNNQFPVRTVFFKHPAAEDAKVFFNTQTTYLFEVYKIGSKEDINKVLDSFKKDAGVENISAGVVTGDFQAFSLLLKTHKDKAWFSEKFKDAGLNNIRINNHPPVPVEKL